jgi:hypothetical protein
MSWNQTVQADEPERPSIITEFGEALADLHDVTQKLERRLAVVSRSTEPTTSEDAKVPSNDSEIRNRLRDLRDTTARLRGLLGRLEV